MGHRDSDFFAFGAETQLPLVNISAPTVSFFIAAPALTAAFYVYLHFYLDGLWVALAKCPARVDWSPVEEHVYPTMLCTAALVIRRFVRREANKPVEGSRAGTVAISVLMVWLLGPLVLGLLWWRSMPYHDEWVTLWAAFWLWLTLIAGGRSIFQLLYVMRFRELSPCRPLQRAFVGPKVIISTSLLVFLLPVFLWVSWQRTESGHFVPLAPVDLFRAELSQKPADWLHYDIWLQEQEHQFRLREGLDMTDSPNSWPAGRLNQFRRETADRWKNRTQSLEAPDLQRKDLRKANLENVFASGANLSGARFDGANLKWARFEGAHLAGARFEGADLFRARFEGADAREVRFKGAKLLNARFKGANGREARFEGARLTWARFNHADFSGARFDAADLTGAWFDNASLSRARFDNADLSQVKFIGASLSGARFDGADLILARFDGANLSQVKFNGADLRNARFDGASFFITRLEGANLENAKGLTQLQLNSACGDQHTRLPDEFSIPMCGDSESRAADPAVGRPPPRHRIHPNQVSTWKQRAVEGMKVVFAAGVERTRGEHEVEIRDPGPGGKRWTGR